MRKQLLPLIFLLSIVGLKAQYQSLTNYRRLAIDTKGDIVDSHENGFVEYNNKIYLFGGRGNTQVNLFDPNYQ